MCTGRNRGFALASVLAWMAAIASVVLAATAWNGDRGSEEAAVSGRPTDPDEVRTLRLAVSTTEAQNAALRSELDRLLLEPGGRSGGIAMAVPGATGAAPGAEPQTSPELVERIRDSVTRAAASGDKAEAQEAALALAQVFQMGPAGFPVVRDAYLATNDPKARQMMLPVMMFVGGGGARDLIFDQLQSETDPLLRNTLLVAGARYVTPENASQVQGPFLQALDSDVDPKTRVSALHGLRYAHGDDVDRALLAAARDSDENVRRAALNALGGRPSTSSQLHDILGQETSQSVRRIGECRLLVSGGR